MSQTLASAEDYKSVVDKFDTFLFDCDGVIWEGDHIIDNVKPVLDHLRSLGKQIFFVTNNATKSREENLKKFIKMGVQATVDEVFTSAYASAAYIKNVLKLPADKKVYVLGEKGVEDELDAVGVLHSGGTDPEDNVLLDLMDFSSITSDPTVGAVLCGLDMHLNYKKVAKGFKFLRENEGCHFVATNLDSTFPTHGTVYPGGGATTAALMYCAGREPIVVGKPEAAMLDSIVEVNKLDRTKMIMVGDRLDTDILFGTKGGIATLMVLTGVNSRADFEKENPTAVPTYVVNSLGDLHVLA